MRPKKGEVQATGGLGAGCARERRQEVQMPWGGRWHVFEKLQGCLCEWTVREGKLGRSGQGLQVPQELLV